MSDPSILYPADHVQIVLLQAMVEDMGVIRGLSAWFVDCVQGDLRGNGARCKLGDGSLSFGGKLRFEHSGDWFI